MSDAAAMQTRTMRGLLNARRGRNGRIHWTDVFTYLYLTFGIFLMFGPVIWLTMSSFKTSSALLEFPPTFLPLGQIEVQVEGYDKPLPLFDVTLEDGTVGNWRRCAASESSAKWSIRRTLAKNTRCRSISVRKFVNSAWHGTIIETR